MEPDNGPKRAKKKLSINPIILAKAEKLAKKRKQSLSAFAEDVIARELRAVGIDPWAEESEDSQSADLPQSEKKP